jgi:8-oxo-dGTP diphosphatase
MTMPKKDQGITTDRFTVVPRTLIFLFQSDRVLLIKGAPDKRLWANKLNGIGGHIEPREDVLTSARRELAEETGLQADLHLCGTVVVDAGQSTGVSIYVFKGEYQGGNVVVSEEGCLEWVALSNLLNLPLVEDLQILLPRIADWQPGKAIFHANYFYDDADRLQIRFYDIS